MHGHAIDDFLGEVSVELKRGSAIQYAELKEAHRVRKCCSFLPSGKELGFLYPDCLGYSGSLVA